MRSSGQREPQPLTTSLLMAPGLGWLVVFMVVPSLIVLVVAFFERGTYGGVDWAAPTVDNFRRAVDPLYATIFLDSASVAGAATLIALLIGLGVYPKPVLDVVNPAVDHTLTTINQHDPAPTKVAEGVFE